MESVPVPSLAANEAGPKASKKQSAKRITMKFGALPADYEGRIDAATPAELDRWVEQVLTADSLDAVFAK